MVVVAIVTITLGEEHISENAMLWLMGGMFAYRRIFPGEEGLIWDLIFLIVLAIGSAGFTYLV